MPLSKILSIIETIKLFKQNCKGAGYLDVWSLFSTELNILLIEHQESIGAKFSDKQLEKLSKFRNMVFSEAKEQFIKFSEGGMSFDLITQALLTEAKILFMRQEGFIRLVESNEWRKELVSKIRNVSIGLIDLDIGLKTIKEVLLLENEEKLDKVSSVKMLFEQRFKNVPVTEKSLNDVIKFVESIL